MHLFFYLSKRSEQMKLELIIDDEPKVFNKKYATLKDMQLASQYLVKQAEIQADTTTDELELAEKLLELQCEFLSNVYSRQFTKEECFYGFQSKDYDKIDDLIVFCLGGEEADENTEKKTVI